MNQSDILRIIILAKTASTFAYEAGKCISNGDLERFQLRDKQKEDALEQLEKELLAIYGGTLTASPPGPKGPGSITEIKS